ncbi:MAG: 30S ribosome-binding factor RbfA [Bifidobacteriaceae bacterium]|nr:30S ribosome-binding factor RbfA [Bifidobacteriaceae bacterium]
MAGTNPRAARIAALIQRVIASSIETHLHDKRLKNVTITEVRVTNDLQHARIFWTQLGHEGREDGERNRAKQALEQAKGRLRTLVGTKAGLRLTPQLHFVYDDVPGEATEIEDILVMVRKRDEELAKSRANAQYAGDTDPYKHDEPEDGEDLESDDTESSYDDYEDSYEELD